MWKSGLFYRVRYLDGVNYLASFPHGGRIILADIGGGDQLLEASSVFWKGVENGYTHLFFLV